MCTRTTLRFVLPLTPLLAFPASAQTAFSPSIRRGMLSTSAVAISVRQAPGVPDEVLLSPPGDQALPPSAFTPSLFPTGPDYRLSVLFPSHGDIQVDAFSTGNDLIGEIESDGTVDLMNPFPRWQAITVAVSETAEGVPGGLLGVPPLSTEGPESHLLGYYFIDSTGIPAGLIDTLQLEQGSNHLGFPSGSDQVVDALDWALGVQSFSDGAPSSIVFLYGLGEFYFSVTPEWSFANPTGFAVDSGGAGVTTRANDIYVTRFASGSWSTPELFLSASQLNLADEQHDVDALAYDALSQTAVFSTNVVSGASQLLAYSGNWGPGVPSAPSFKSGDDEKVTKKVGLKDVSDDVTAICIVDPEPGHPDHYLGLDLESLGFFPVDSGISVHRSIGPGGNSTVHLQATGLGLSGIPANEVDFLLYIEGTGSLTSVTVPYDVVNQRAELTIPIGSISVGNVRCAASSWSAPASGPRTLVAFSWIADIDI